MSTEAWFMKAPCKHCPFRKDVKPFLTPTRGEELAYHTENPYNSFPCHKTTVLDDSDDEGSEMMTTENSLECAGFLTLKAQQTGEWPEGFEPAWEQCYVDTWEMIDAYSEQD